IGARDPQRARRALAGSLVVAQGVSITGLLLAIVAPRAILGALDASPDVIAVKATLSLLLVFGELGLPSLGLTGAGVATFSAHAVGLALYVLLSRRAV